jgi:hypothetical protein
LRISRVEQLAPCDAGTQPLPSPLWLSLSLSCVLSAWIEWQYHRTHARTHARTDGDDRAFLAGILDGSSDLTGLMLWPAAEALVCAHASPLRL